MKFAGPVIEFLGWVATVWISSAGPEAPYQGLPGHSDSPMLFHVLETSIRHYNPLHPRPANGMLPKYLGKPEFGPRNRAYRVTTGTSGAFYIYGYCPRQWLDENRHQKRNGRKWFLCHRLTVCNWWRRGYLQVSQNWAGNQGPRGDYPPEHRHPLYRLCLQIWWRQGQEHNQSGSLLAFTLSWL